MTEMLYMKDIESNYIREFDASVVEQGDGHVVLDRSAFYPKGGGQESDTGVLRWSAGEARIHEVIRKGKVLHCTRDPLPSGIVHGVLDWERRYAHMRMHTAQHIISGLVYDLYRARTVGNQIHAERSRVDFAPASFPQEDLVQIVERCSEIAARGARVRIYEAERAEIEKLVDSQRANMDLLPKSISRLRIVEIEGFDLCPCAGTHVRNTAEIGRLRLLGRESKGRETVRVSYTLEHAEG
ncbi:MAG: alanyl-tRNA editing protein [Candidatus Thermoplasmatota archaeon]